MKRLRAILPAVLLLGCAGEEPREPPPPRPWVVQDLGSHAAFHDLFFLDERRGWMVGGGHDISGGIVGRTEDGGRTWRFSSGVARPSSRASSFHLNAVWFVDERVGFIVGDGYHILRTVDGGEHWHEVSRHQRVWAHLHDVQFVGRLRGWAVGSGGFARTFDGGATWTGAPVVEDGSGNVRDPRGRALHFVDWNRGWMVGSGGRIRTTSDAGATWQEVRAPKAANAPDLWGVDFAGDRHGWAVGERGTILHTSDGGATWNRQPSGVRDLLMDVDFVDPSLGWVVGFDRRTGSSTVLRTSDGGVTWTEEARISSEAMRSVFALDRHSAWAVGEQQRRGLNDGSQKLLRYEPEG